MRLSAEARAKLTEPWEECVLFVYDDKVARRYIDGRLQYPEWDGGPVRGTLTVAIGHTDAAGPPKIYQGMRLTRERADQIFEADIAPCERRVNSLLRREITQHQFDMLVDLDFNCPSAVTRVMPYVNRGDWASVHRIMGQFVYSKGERMLGLVHRRTAEIAWSETPDDPDEAAATIICPKGEREPAPKSMAESTIGTATIAAGAGTGISTLGLFQTVSDVSSTVEQTKASADNLGLTGQFLSALHTPAVALLLGIAVIVLLAYVWLERRRKLLEDHI